ncbi:SMI1/KNR4 family protein [Haloferula sp. BvORR071]|uniref:SMI1/KNR4 family protein n=1 Tax=Haloferula sp. BvORR071 TaxID=1396141 RepID=UPI0006990DE4|nr:SMI1/KNR4 family protein [Haloferula sp. BvORR071]
MSKHKRVIGTTPEAIARAEQQLGRSLPKSFREWLLANNGLGLGSISIFPVQDDRDVRKTWASIVQNYQNGWEAWLEIYEDERDALSSLLPFAEFSTGDYYCFDYSRVGLHGEPPVVLWSHESENLEPRGEWFVEFKERLLKGEFEYD